MNEFQYVFQQLYEIEHGRQPALTGPFCGRFPAKLLVRIMFHFQ